MRSFRNLFVVLVSLASLTSAPPAFSQQTYKGCEGQRTFNTVAAARLNCEREMEKHLAAMAEESKSIAASLSDIAKYLAGNESLGVQFKTLNDRVDRIGIVLDSKLKQ